MLRKCCLSLAALAALGLGLGAASTAQAGHGHGGGHHGGHGGHGGHHHYDDHHHHHHHSAYRGGYGYGFGYAGPSQVRSIYGPAYQSYYRVPTSGYGYGGRGYDSCYGPSYRRGGVSVSFGF